MNLTIAIPTMPGRESTLSRLLHCLEPQLPFCDVVVISGPGGLGNKINQAFALPGDGWVAVVDDDDLVVSDFAETVAVELRSQHYLHYLGYDILCTAHGRYWMTNHTRANRCGDWTGVDRGPSIKGVVAKSIGSQIVFGNGYEADRRWTPELARRIRHHDYIERPLYHYDWWEAYAWKAEGRDVGQWPYNPANFTFIEEQT